MSASQSVLFAAWLLLLPASHSAPTELSCTSAQADRCKAAESAPGSMLAGQGFDVVTLQIKPAYVIDMNTWQRPNGSCTLCQNTLMKKQWQRLPAAVENWRCLKGNSTLSASLYGSSKAFILDSLTDVGPSWKQGLDLNDSTLIVGGTQSEAARTVTDRSNQDKFSFVKQELWRSYYSYSVRKNPPLSPKFAQSIMSLPAQYNDTTQVKYMNFLATFGTHSMHKVVLGGRVKSVTSVKTCKATLEGFTEMEVRNCLNVEAAAAAGVKSPEIKPQRVYCRKATKQHPNLKSFSRKFNVRFTQVVGGSSGNKTNPLFSVKDFGKWKKGLTRKPGIVDYSLIPLYQLVKDPSRRSGLKLASEDYIQKNALKKQCSNNCVQGSTPSSHDPCTCACRPTSHVGSNCCPLQRSLAHLTVTVKSASGLWGDVLTKTDAFVKVFAGNQTFQTSVIYNNDDPQWDEEFYLGTVELLQMVEVKFEVWDEDDQWFDRQDDLLGSCAASVKAGSVTSVCPMNHGNFYFSYTAECAPGLRGTTCSEYSHL
ncbi:perforin-1 [Fundulus heteroclitus]|uniref:perforin-1 n=1 Tax=Fundulus heteroclitus TaxID=8078 RepID=UPI00165A6DC8|nr:perforin-1 [Fundulus heteroclitus]